MRSTSIHALSLALAMVTPACDSPATPVATSETGETGDGSTGTDGSTGPDGSTSGDDAATGDGSATGDSSGEPEAVEGRTVFVTSTVHGPDLGGLVGADEICQQAAAGLTGEPAAATFKAWLSVDGESAASRLEPWDGPYVRTDGSQVAANWENLVDGVLDVRVNRDENDQLVEGESLAWTGTNPDGSSFDGDDSCGGWDSTGTSALAGSTDDNGPWWTSFGQVPCDQQLRLYCIEQAPECGDGVLNAGEECDDGNTDDGDDCTPTCVLPVCGDGVLNGMEACDGLDLGGLSCEGRGFDGGTLVCDPSCNLDPAGCFACGDGVLNGMESCDGLDFGGQDCVSQGFDGGVLACDAFCAFDPAGCYGCGDGVLNGMEPCDGVDLDGQDCITQGFDGGMLACDASCAFDTSGCHVCGDGVVNGTETCDDGNADETDACTTLCAPPACDDGLVSGDESDLDCGGVVCDSCAFGQACLVPEDCLGGSCIGSQCAVVPQIAAKHYKTCALVGSLGTARCWGDNSFGQLGYGNTQNIGDGPAEMPPLDIDVGGTVVGLATGYWHTCAVLEGGAVRCWGRNDQGQLGYGNTMSIGDDELPSVAGDVDVGGPVVQVVTGYLHTCALLETGAVRCWGDNALGQLGSGGSVVEPNNIGDDETPASIPTVDVGGTVVELATDRNVTCAVLDTGGVRCWGEGAYYSHGYPTSQDVGDDETPASMGDVDVGGLVDHVAVGTYHTCALLQDGTVRCWGRSYDLLLQENGHLGSGIAPDTIGDDESPASRPVVDVGGVVVALTAGTSHTCALLQTGGVRCWGRGAQGRLGYGNTNTIGDDEVPSTAGDVTVGGVVEQLAAGEYHTCARLDTNDIRCWGTSSFGQLGYGNLAAIGDDETPASAGNVPYL